MASRIHRDRACPRLSTLQVADSLVLAPHESKCIVGASQEGQLHRTANLGPAMLHCSGTLSQCSDMATCSHDISEHDTPAQRP